MHLSNFVLASPLASNPGAFYVVMLPGIVRQIKGITVSVKLLRKVLIAISTHLLCGRHVTVFS